MSTEQLMKDEKRGVWKDGMQTEISIREYSTFLIDKPRNPDFSCHSLI